MIDVENSDVQMVCDTVLKGVALVGLNVLAIIYDSNWLYVAVGIDALVLGYEIRGLAVKAQRREGVHVPADEVQG